MKTLTLSFVVLLAILGIGGIGGGFYVGTYVDDQIASGLEDAIVNSASHEDYNDWLTSEDTDDSPFYKRYNFWNLTNPDDYLTGSDPVMEEIGPYVYRQYDRKLNVEFDGALVSYQTYTYYVFENTMSDTESGMDLSEDDVIVNINPQYLGVLAIAGSEQALVVGFVGTVVQTILDGLVGSFVDGVLVQGFPTVLSTVQAGVTEQFHVAVNATTSANLINGSWGGVADAINNATAYAGFFNDTSFQGNFGTPIKGVSEYITVNMEFPLASAEKLLFDGVPALGVMGWLADLSTGMGILGFLTAYQKAITLDGLDNATLQGAYGLSQPQLDVLAGYLSVYLIEDNVVVEGAFIGAYGISTLQGANAMFYEQWANATVLPGGLDINGDGSAPDGFEAGLPTATGINMSSAMMIFDSSNPYALTNDSGIMVWFGAALGNATLFALLSATFKLEAAQLTLVLSWLPTFKDGIAAAGIVASFGLLGITNLDQIGYFQFGSSYITGGASLFDLDPTLGFYPEYWAYATHIAATPDTLNITQSEAFLNGAYAFTDSTMVGYFMLLAASGDFPTISAIWHINATQTGIMMGYLQYLMAGPISAQLAPIFAAGGGLITDRTVHEWLWDYTDPLLAFLLANGQDVDPAAGLFTNMTSADDARISDANQINTGSADINDIGQYVEYHGMTQVDIWASAEIISGTDATRFAPGVDSGESLFSWVGDLMRVVEFTYDSDQELEGIDMLRYILSDDTLASSSSVAANAKYYQGIEGMANMTAAIGAPMFLSKPAFLDADATLLDNLGGVVPDATKHDTFIDVEPITGLSMNVRKRLQISLQVVAQNYFSSGVVENIIPLVWIEEGATVSADLADAFKDAIYGGLDLKQYVQIGGPVAGLAMFVGVAILLKKSKGV